MSWYVYTHESRLVLLASGMQCKSLTGFQVDIKSRQLLVSYAVDSETLANVSVRSILTLAGVRIYHQQLFTHWIIKTVFFMKLWYVLSAFAFVTHAAIQGYS